MEFLQLWHEPQVECPRAAQSAECADAPSQASESAKRGTLQCPAPLQLLSWLVLRSNRAKEDVAPFPAVRRLPAQASVSSRIAGRKRRESHPARPRRDRSNLLLFRPAGTRHAGFLVRVR